MQKVWIKGVAEFERGLGGVEWLKAVKEGVEGWRENRRSRGVGRRIGGVERIEGGIGGVREL